MGVVRTILFVAFIIVSVLLVLMVLVQNDEQNGMGGVFGGRQSAAFGSRSASVLTKTTGVFVALFFLIAFGLAFLSSDRFAGDAAKGDTVIDTATQEGLIKEDDSSANWLDAVESEAVIEEGETVDAEAAGEEVITEEAEEGAGALESADVAVETESADAAAE